ncbi:MAG: leucyl/phenylalanyl-tRNA--protein transferase [Rhodocyclaceae bacterium]|nr:leucyl/phenylalanyl-tRNA--protein transferase [Rhodocyclaceae bacterium]
MIPRLPPEPLFPPPSSALSDPNGLLAVGGDLSPRRLLAAYRQGIFPWYAPGDPILWWCPDPRMVLIPKEFKISRSLAKTLRNAVYTVTLDADFAAVIHACATTPRSGQQGTWITREMESAYLRLHELGHAHSVEVWRENRLIGGLYGVAIGKAFFGESMFSLARDASKIALAHLVRYLDNQGYGMIDCQMQTAHLASLGARPIAREEFLALLSKLIEIPAPIGPWPSNAVAETYRRALK